MQLETDSVNVMKKGRLFQTNKGNSLYIKLAQSYKKTVEIVTRNNYTQNVCKAILICDKLLRNLKTSKSIGLMLLVLYNNVIKSS